MDSIVGCHSPSAAPPDSLCDSLGLPVHERYSVDPQSPLYIDSHEEYLKMYSASLSDPDAFWTRHGRELVSWYRPFEAATRDGGRLSRSGNVMWFQGGLLNASYNCVDRWAFLTPHKTAIIAEGDEPGDVHRVSFSELLELVSRFANLLKQNAGVRKGDVVTLYLPTGMDLAVAVLACARIGAIHSVVFAGFSAANLRERVDDAKSRVVISTYVSHRGGKKIELGKIVMEALTDQSLGSEKERKSSFCVVMFGQEPIDLSPKEPSPCVYQSLQIISATHLMSTHRPYCPIEPMDSEDLLFLLYTSGSTGKPKAIAHSTGGYLVYAAMSFKYIFDVHREDVWACMADLGWITGHTYGLYGPLVSGVTTFLFESVPTYPSPSRYWDCVERHRITHFYTAPTALRTLMRFGNEFVTKHDRASLKVLGSVGEPINPEAWRWYFETVGSRRCPIIDSYWQTETGGIVVAPLPHRVMKPGSATLPFFGIDPVVVDALTGRELEGGNVHGLLGFRKAWPGMMRTIFGDHERFVHGYLQELTDTGCHKETRESATTRCALEQDMVDVMSGNSGYEKSMLRGRSDEQDIVVTENGNFGSLDAAEDRPPIYLTGDGCVRDADGYLWITGRVDDVIKVSGHRLGSAEVEHALVQHPAVSEAAVVGFPHSVKGEGLFCFVTLKENVSSVDLTDALKQTVRKFIGPVATPDVIVVTPGLPKTRSGKIMRRVLRKLAHGQADQLGDLSTLADPSVMAPLVQQVDEVLRNR